MKTRSLSQSHFNLLIPICLVLCAIALSAHGATITVINTNHIGPRSLRQALTDPNDRDTINFAVTGAIGLTSGELLVDKSVTISGPGVASLAVDYWQRPVTGEQLQAQMDRMAQHNDTENFGDATLEITNSSLADNSGGALYNDGQYGGRAFLQTNNITVSSNSGGGIYNKAQNARAAG